MSFEFSYLKWRVANSVEDQNPEFIYVCLRILTSENHLCCSDKLSDSKIQK